MRADEEDKLHGEHEADNLVTGAAPEECADISVVGDLGELDLDLADDVAGVNGDETETDAGDDTSNHTEGGEAAGETQTAEGDGLDDEDDCEALPSETVEMSGALLL